MVLEERPKIMNTGYCKSSRYRIFGAVGENVSVRQKGPLSHSAPGAGLSAMSTHHQL